MIACDRAGAGRVRPLGRCDISPGLKALSPGSIAAGTPSMTIASSRLGTQASRFGGTALRALLLASRQAASELTAIRFVATCRLVRIEKSLARQPFRGAKRRTETATGRAE